MNSRSAQGRSFSPSDVLCVLGVIACSFTGFAQVAKYFHGTRALSIAIAIAACVTLALLWLRWRRLTARKKLSAFWLALPWCLFALMFALLYPLAQRHIFGAGSDRADALSVGAAALLRGHYPYRAATYLGNEITPLPGAILLAIPFYLLGSVSLQNLFWLGLFLLVVSRWYFRGHSTAIVYVLVLLGASAANLDDFVVGGDYIVNAMYVCIALAIAAAAHRKGVPLWQQIGSEVFLGLAVDSRPVYFVALPLLLAYLWKRCDRHTAIRAFFVPGFVAAGLSLPFYLYDPGHFSPLHVRHKLDFIPPQYHAAVVLATLGLLASCVGFTVRLSRRRVCLLMGTALFLMLGVPGIAAWFLFPLTLNAWYQLSLATPSALFLSLWIFAIYERTGDRLRRGRESVETAVVLTGEPMIGRRSIARR